MAERSFTKEVQKLRLGEGQEFHGVGYSRRDESAAAIRRFVCCRISGCPDFAFDGRSNRRE